MVMAFGVGDGEPHRDHAEKRRVGKGQVHPAEVVRDIEVQFVAADRYGTPADQRPICPSVIFVGAVPIRRRSPLSDSSSSSILTPWAAMPLQVSSTWVETRPYTLRRSAASTR